MTSHTLFSGYARKKKIRYFFKRIPKECRILEIGCRGGWLSDYFIENGYHNYVSLDVVPPADIVGNICQWQELGIKAESFDIIIAFEVVEHVDCWQDCYKILKPGGMLMVTTPMPHMDWLLEFLEIIGLCQKRTSPHTNLVYLKKIPFFRIKKIKTICFLSQWGVFTK